MAFDAFKRLAPGKPISARAVNGALREVEQFSRLSIAQGLGLLRIGGGLQLLGPAEDAITARVVAQTQDQNKTPAFALQEVIRLPDGSGWQDLPTGISTTTDAAGNFLGPYLYEANARALAVGDVVEATAVDTDAGQAWVADVSPRPRVSFGGGGSASGTSSITPPLTSLVLTGSLSLAPGGKYVLACPVLLTASLDPALPHDLAFPFAYASFFAADGTGALATVDPQDVLVSSQGAQVVNHSGGPQTVAASDVVVGYAEVRRSVPMNVALALTFSGGSASLTTTLKDVPASQFAGAPSAYGVLALRLS